MAEPAYSGPVVWSDEYATWVCDGCGRLHHEDEFDPPSMQLEGFRQEHAQCPRATHGGRRDE